MRNGIHSYTIVKSIYMHQKRKRERERERKKEYHFSIRPFLYKTTSHKTTSLYDNFSIRSTYIRMGTYIYLCTINMHVHVYNIINNYIHVHACIYITSCLYWQDHITIVKIYCNYYRY